MVNGLFQVDETCRKLDTQKADLFHRIIPIFLYVTKREKPNLQVAVSILCKQVKAPNVGNWKKQGRFVRYMRATTHLPLILGSNGSGNMVWSINASFVVHMDIKSHTRYCLTLRMGALISGSQSQKINTRSSADSELFGVNNVISCVK